MKHEIRLVELEKRRGSEVAEAGDAEGAEDDAAHEVS
jgi:hypothetical protein